MSQEFDDALNDCLERMARGESAGRCIERYPQHARDLLPLLTTAHRTMQVSEMPVYRPDAKIRGMNLMLEALADNRMSKIMLSKPVGGCHGQEPTRRCV